MWAVARRPRWIGLLVFALVLAALFAFLGRWQLERAVESAHVDPSTTETQRTLDRITTPQTATPEDLAGQRVRVTGHFVPGDTIVLTGRSGGGRFQTVGHFVDARTGASLPVVIGYADSRRAATAGGERAATGRTVSVVGRYYPSESPDQDAFQKGEHSAVAVALLVNEWHGFDGDVYGGYVVATAATASPAHLGTIADRAPSHDVQLNWLNLFYAVEWVVFAGFAVFLWYRFVKDAWEREQDEADEGPGGGGDGGPDDDDAPDSPTASTDAQETQELAGAGAAHR
jgi:surfeit locus 1 family protein